MAKQNDNVGSTAPMNPPTPEQTGELLLILDKEKMLLQALAKTDVDGKLKTVRATPENNNQFLRINPSDNWLQAFATNFWSQAKDPTRFSLIKLNDKQMEDPLVKRAMQDIEQGQITKDVVRFLKKYEVKSDEITNTNNQKTEKMATEQNQGPATVEEQEPRRHRFHEAMIDWNQVEAHGFTRERLEQNGLFDKMMRGYKSDELLTVTSNTAGTENRYKARISFRQEDSGRVILQTHPIKLAPEFSKPFLGHSFSDDDKVNLMQTGNMGRVVPLRTRDGREDCFVSLDRKTNHLYSAKVEGAFIGDEYSGIKLTDHEKNELREGRAVYIEGLISKEGKEFNATLQYNAEKRGVEFIFDKSLKYGQELGKMPLTNKQVDDYNAGKAIFVENMVSKKTGEQFSSFVKRDDMSGRANYSRINPDNPSEIWVPGEINAVKITPDERQLLREGKEIWLKDMTSARGEEFSSFVKLDPNNGYPMFSQTIEGFEQKSEFKIPHEVYGVTLSVTQRADLQDGKPVFVENMKGNGMTFSQWAQKSADGKRLNWYHENPELKREAAARKAAQVQTAKQEQKEEPKKGRSQGVR